MVREVTKNLMVTLTEIHSPAVEMGEPSRRTTISAALYQSGLNGGVASRLPLLSKRLDSPLGDCQKEPKRLSLWLACQASHLEDTWLHPYGEAWWWQHHAEGCFSVAGTGRLVRIEGKMNGAKYREILD